MASEWLPTTLGRLLSFANGRTSPERDDCSRFAVFGANGAIGRSGQSNSPAATIVIGRVGSYCGAVHFSSEPCWVTDNAIRAVANPGTHPYFAFCLLRMLDLNRWRAGSGQPLINQSILSSIEVEVPPPALQASVGCFLAQIDDRIDLLHQTNATLESIAQALFKSWFIDFDPVRAKAEGREPDGMDVATAALFPTDFEESALGLIPRGWSVARLGDMIELAYGKALKATDRRPGCVPVYGSGGITGYHDEALVKHASIVVGRKGTVGALYWEDAPFFPIDTTFYVKPKMTPLTFCFYAMQRLGLTHMNTDAAVPGLNRENAYRLEVLRPVGEVLEAFDHLVGPLREAMRTNGLRADTLVQLRDSLLPRLISGKLRLPEAQAQLEEAIA